MSSLRPIVPAALDRLVKTCLVKDPDDRWQTEHDVKLQLQSITEASTQEGVGAPAATPRKLRERLSWTAMAVFALAAILFAAEYLRRPSEELRSVRSLILPPENAKFTSGLLPGPVSVSPDGRYVAFSASNPDGKKLLWVRPLDSLAAQPLTGTDRAAYPFWSPDSRYIGFFADSKLKKIDRSGGPAIALCDASQPRGGTWATDGTILFSPAATGPIYRVSEAGGAPAPVTKIDPSSKNEATHRWSRSLREDSELLLGMFFAPQRLS